MSEWVKTSWAKPPQSMSVLLYIVEMYDDKESLWEEDIFIGFWSDEMMDDYEGWFLETREEYKPFRETETCKILAWTLLPQKPYVDFKNQNGTELLEVFKPSQK